MTPTRPWPALLLLVLLGGCGGRGATPPTPVREPVREPVAPAPASPALLDAKRARVLVAGSALVLEIAADWASRGQGLSGRTSIPEGGGMIFVYPRSEGRGFWMKGCLIGLDIAFVDETGLVHEIHSLDPPAPDAADEAMPRARTSRPTRYVIETRKGWFAREGIEAGARVELPPELKALAEDGAEDV